MSPSRAWKYKENCIKHWQTDLSRCIIPHYKMILKLFSGVNSFVDKTAEKSKHAQKTKHQISFCSICFAYLRGLCWAWFPKGLRLGRLLQKPCFAVHDIPITYTSVISTQKYFFLRKIFLFNWWHCWLTYAFLICVSIFPVGAEAGEYCYVGERKQIAA